MSYYDDRPDDLKLDAKNFLASDYGKYLVATLEEVGEGYLASVANIAIEHPERYAAKYGAIKEVLNLLYSPLGDDTPSHG